MISYSKDIDLKKVIQKKAVGLATVKKAGEQFMIYTKRFDQETGEELTPHVDIVSIAELNTRIAEIQAVINDLKAIKK